VDLCIEDELFAQTPASPERDELMAVCRRLGRLNHAELLCAYRRAHETCRSGSDGLPRLGQLRELFVIWRLAEAWRLRKERMHRAGHGS
jgi:hypothetical protein